ncbi:aldo/keto reductase [Saccharopolyspora spinosporotrichia]
MQLPIEAGAARETSLAVARRAVELGVTLIDTAHMYGGGADEELLAEALHPYPDGLLVTTKVGVARSGPSGEWRLDGRPVVLCDQVEQALRRLRVERLELLQLHRVDPRDIAGRPARRAAAPPGRRQDRQDRPVRGHRRRTPPSGEIVDLASVQNRYNLLDREHEPVLAACEEAGSRSCRGVLSPGGIRHEGRGRRSGGRVRSHADAGRARLAPRPLAGHPPDPGTARVDYLEENLAAERLQLTRAHRERLDQIPDLAQGTPSYR